MAGGGHFARLGLDFVAERGNGFHHAGAGPNCMLDYVHVGMMAWGGSDPAIAGQERSIK
jgi:hypothetical protein